jgi:hypothetical protein
MYNQHVIRIDPYGMHLAIPIIRKTGMIPGARINFREQEGQYSKKSLN